MVRHEKGSMGQRQDSLFLTQTPGNGKLQTLSPLRLRSLEQDLVFLQACGLAGQVAGARVAYQPHNLACKHPLFAPSRDVPIIQKSPSGAGWRKSGLGWRGVI